jgi:hypothetical protein
MQEIFLTSTRSDDDYAGVIEHDGETTYFYLYCLKRPEGERIIDSINLTDERNQFSESDIEIKWNESETRVMTFLRGELWAAFSVK